MAERRRVYTEEDMMAALDQIIAELTECAMRHCVKILMQAAEIFRFAVCDALPRR